MNESNEGNVHYNVIRVTSGKFVNRIALVKVKPRRKTQRRHLRLRKAEYLLCNVGFDYAAGFIAGFRMAI